MIPTIRSGAQRPDVGQTEYTEQRQAQTVRLVPAAGDGAGRGVPERR